jgi:putative FmdB family regulatory protein
MPTYEYECKGCGLRFERRQPITDEPLTECPECRGEVRRLIGGGAGFIIKGSGRGHAGYQAGACSLDEIGTTCCGRSARCDKPPCEGEG